MTSAATRAPAIVGLPVWAALAAEQNHLGKLDDIAGAPRDLLHLDDVVRRHAILLAACANDREHVRFPPGFWLEGPALWSAQASRMGP